MTTEPTDLAGLFTSIQAGLAPMFELFDWFDDELAKAQANHPDAADLLHHAFEVCHKPNPMPHAELTYRSHVRELLARIVAGADLRPPTWAEACVVLSETSLRAPMRPGASLLYGRAFTRAFPDLPDSPWTAEDLAAYERLHGTDADTFERDLFRTLTRRPLVPRPRELAGVDCDGRHHGEEVTCRFTKTTLF